MGRFKCIKISGIYPGKKKLEECKKRENVPTVHIRRKYGSLGGK
jgi:hypothetical protein